MTTTEPLSIDALCQLLHEAMTGLSSDQVAALTAEYIQLEVHLPRLIAEAGRARHVRCTSPRRKEWPFGDRCAQRAPKKEACEPCRKLTATSSDRREASLQHSALRTCLRCWAEGWTDSVRVAKQARACCGQQSISQRAYLRKLSAVLYDHEVLSERPVLEQEDTTYV